MGISRMRGFVLCALFIGLACLYADSATEIADLGNAAEQETYSPDECSSVRESLPSLCKMFGPSQCASMKEKLHRSCHEVKASAKETPEAQDVHLGEDDDMDESVGRRASALTTSGSFTMSASSSNRAGNSEELGEDEDEDESETEYSKELMSGNATERKHGCAWMLMMQMLVNASIML